MLLAKEALRVLNTVPHCMQSQALGHHRQECLSALGHRLARECSKERNYFQSVLQKQLLLQRKNKNKEKEKYTSSLFSSLAANTASAASCCRYILRSRVNKDNLFGRSFSRNSSW